MTIPVMEKTVGGKGCEKKIGYSNLGHVKSELSINIRYQKDMSSM